MKTPEIFFCKDAFLKVCKEVEKWFNIGMNKQKIRWESAMYPLGTIETRVNKSPLEILELHEIKRVIITHVFFPPDRFKNFSSGYAKFKPGTDTYFNPIIENWIEKYPLLELFCKLHSHTVNGSGLSEGDLNGHIFNSVDWFRSKGLNTIFSFLVTPKNKSLNIQCFAPDKDAKIVKVPINFISHSHPLIKSALSKPYYETQKGSVWCDKNKSLLKEGFSVVRNNLKLFGWKQYIIKINQTEYIFCLSPQFPQVGLKLYKVEHQNGKFIFKPSNLPKWWPKSNVLSDYNLVDLANWLKERSFK
ncbi:hypothetical protein ACFL1Y_00035 [Patescibacteria group bacterium]